MIVREGVLLSLHKWMCPVPHTCTYNFPNGLGRIMWVKSFGSLNIYTQAHLTMNCESLLHITLIQIMVQHNNHFESKWLSKQLSSKHPSYIDINFSVESNTFFPLVHISHLNVFKDHISNIWSKFLPHLKF